MDFKKIRKSISRFLGWISLLISSLIVGFLSEKAVYSLARGFGRLGYRFARKQRKIALDSLNLALGKEKSPQEIEQIARDCFTFIAKGGLEVLFLIDKPELMKRRIRFAGRDNLDEALRKGKGVILVSAHFGNFPLMLGRLSIEGYKTASIMRPMRDSRVEKLFLKKRAKFGVRTIYSQPRKACVDDTLKALRNNELVFIPLDQNFGTAGVFVDFFGTKAATATGPVVFALRTGAALIPCFIIRQSDDTHEIVFEPPFTVEKAKDYQETVTVNIQRLTGIIESYIRRYPAEWGWIHRRWKSRPAQSQKEV